MDGVVRWYGHYCYSMLIVHGYSIGERKTSPSCVAFFCVRYRRMV
jgi:hypothetical protein